jgi:hypothetical protein
MRIAVGGNGGTEGRVAVVEPEQGEHAVHVDEEHGSVFSSHQESGR